MDEETKPKTKKRKKRTYGVRGPIEVRAGGKRYYGYDIEFTACGLVVILHDRRVVIPVTKPIEIFQPPGQVAGEIATSYRSAEARRAPYDPQLPHNAEGNLTLDELERREEHARAVRQQEIEDMRARRNAEIEQSGNGLPPFIPTLVGTG